MEYPMQINNNYLKTLLLIIPLFLSGCSESHDDKDVDDSTTMNVENYSESNEESNGYNDNDEYNGRELYKAGLISIDIAITQLRNVNKAVESGHVKTTSSYVLNAHYKREALVANDLSDPFFDVLPEDTENDEDFKPNAFSDGPYTTYDFNDKDFPAAEITGSVNYLLDHEYLTPDHVDTIKHTKFHTMKGDIIDIEIDNMKLSKIGLGYQFDLKIHKELAVTTKDTLTYHKGPEQQINESGDDFEPLEFIIMPLADKKAIDRNFYSDMEIQFNVKKRDIESYELFRDHLKNDKYPFIKYCIPSKEIATKDKLTITCEYKGNNWLPLDGNIFVGMPETSIAITFTIATK
jgi:hypothetical protein